ncbi:hypothetical protein [Spirosoma endophyticum]|uniref:Uncharacterized protein n=1 Tax=Spirosoma endophyticum TaxID=662367 RepID=A0A1I1FUZ0_9BACT|nr:hypothetical protein [Spirosoma endophyticum]SFC03125.1 hypothetical protein SAMN05216167_101315 [Spirosoma endophyticum]
MTESDEKNDQNKNSGDNQVYLVSAGIQYVSFQDFAGSRATV